MPDDPTVRRKISPDVLNPFRPSVIIDLDRKHVHDKLGSVRRPKKRAPDGNRHLLQISFVRGISDVNNIVASLIFIARHLQPYRPNRHAIRSAPVGYATEYLSLASRRLSMCISPLMLCRILYHFLLACLASIRTRHIKISLQQPSPQPAKQPYRSNRRQPTDQ